MSLRTKIIQKQRFIVVGVVVLFLLALYFLVPAPAHYWLAYWWMFPIALLIALMVNTAGISGAALFVPFFILLFPHLSGNTLAPITSVKLGLLTESFGLSSSALAFLAFGLVDTTLARRAIIRALPFVFVGVFVVFLVPKAVLYIIISILLLLSLFLMRYQHVLKKKRLREQKAQSINIDTEEGEHVRRQSKDHHIYHYCRSKAGARKRFIGYGVGGIFQGAAGFGIGELGIISMMLTKIPTRIAIGTSHFIVAGTAIFASGMHFLLQTHTTVDVFPWQIVMVTIPAVIIGGQLAPYVAAKLSSRHLERFVSILFIIIAVSLFLLAVGELRV